MMAPHDPERCARELANGMEGHAGQMAALGILEMIALDPVDLSEADIAANVAKLHPPCEAWAQFSRAILTSALLLDLEHGGTCNETVSRTAAQMAACVRMHLGLPPNPKLAEIS